jgi:hypothetical protein
MTVLQNHLNINSTEGLSGTGMLGGSCSFGIISYRETRSTDVSGFS